MPTLASSGVPGGDSGRGGLRWAVVNCAKSPTARRRWGLLSGAREVLGSDTVSKINDSDPIDLIDLNDSDPIDPNQKPLTPPQSVALLDYFLL